MNSQGIIERGMVSHRLTEQEEKFYAYGMDALVTLTWFKGDFKKASVKLGERLRSIVEKNPWLQGSITSTYRFGNGRKYYLSYEKNDGETSFNVDENLETVLPIDSPIHREDSFGEIGGILRDAGLIMIKNGPHEPVFKATIIPCKRSPDEKFALVFQMSHVVGDGATYYKVLDMLCSTSDDAVVELNPKRILTSNKMQADAMGKEEVGYFNRVSNLMTFLVGALINAIRMRRAVSCYGWVDPDKMKETKKIAADEGGVPFVSTNDVISRLGS